MLIVTLGGLVNRKISFNANYTFGKAMSDTDGAGTFASNPYDFSAEYGRTGGDVRHRFSLNGSYRGPWGLSFSPMLLMTSGTPFNITIGRDTWLGPQVTITRDTAPGSVYRPSRSELRDKSSYELFGVEE